MGFFDKVKSSLNIGGAKVVLDVPNVVNNGDTMDVKVTITGGKMDQKITGVTAKLSQKDSWTERKMDGTRTTKSKVTVLSDASEGGFDLKAGEVKELTFQLQVTAITDGSQQEGMMGTLSKMNNFAQQRKHGWHVEASADIEGSVDPKATQDVTVNM